MFVSSLMHVGNGTHTVLRAWTFPYIKRYNVQFHLGDHLANGSGPLGGPFSEVLLYI